jgi:hypothetical protein
MDKYEKIKMLHMAIMQIGRLTPFILTTDGYKSTLRSLQTKS